MYDSSEKLNVILNGFSDLSFIKNMSDSNLLNNNFGNTNINIIAYRHKFNGCLWNENYEETRALRKDLEELKKLNNLFVDLNSKILIIFDKPDITKEDLNDEYCNNLLRIFSKGDTLVYSKSKVLRRYIKTKYKKISILDSQRKIENYNILIVNKSYELNYSFDIEIFKLKYEQLEFIINNELNKINFI